MKHSTKLVITSLLFITIGFIALQIPTFEFVGTGAKFTVFDMIAPASAAFLGTLPGLLAVLLMRLANVFIVGGGVFDIFTIVRFFPILFGAFYFSKKREYNVLIPVISIIVFLAHPIGREVWYFTLLWLVPIFLHFWSDKNLLARSLGATMAQHSVGGAIMIWAFDLSASFWQSLIPLVIAERLIIAGGIALSYLGLRYALKQINNKLKNVNIGFQFTTDHT